MLLRRCRLKLGGVQAYGSAGTPVSDRDTQSEASPVIPSERSESRDPHPRSREPYARRSNGIGTWSAASSGCSRCPVGHRSYTTQR